MQELNVVQMKNSIVATFSRIFKCDLLEAEQNVNNSSFVITLGENPEYIASNDSEYWARKIKKETDTVLELKKLVSKIQKNKIS